MIEILHYGHRKYEKYCLNCGCHFTYELDDLEDFKIRCPFCLYENQNTEDDGIDDRESVEDEV